MYEIKYKKINNRNFQLKSKKYYFNLVEIFFDNWFLLKIFYEENNLTTNDMEVCRVKCHNYNTNYISVILLCQTGLHIYEFTT